MPTSQDAIVPVYRDEGEARRARDDLVRNLSASTRPRILFATHGRGGGVARHVNELAGMLSDRAEVLLLRPFRRSWVELSGTGGFAGLRTWFHRDDEWTALVAFLRSVGISRIHFHHVQGLPAHVLDLGTDLGCPWDITVHDYYPVCPQYQLTDASGRYCGEPDAAGCARCLAANPPQWPMDIAAWRGAFAPVVVNARRVIAPSRDAAVRIRRYFPSVEPVTWPHVESHAPVSGRRKILILGGLSPSKGMDVLTACARDARARGLALEFRVIGHIAWPVDDGDPLPISFTGEFAEGSLARLIEQERGDAIFFPAQWPETYSYTLTDAIESGLPILATNLGALPERLANVARARIVDWSTDGATLNDQLLQLTDGTAPASTRVNEPADAGKERASYVERYLEGIVTAPAAQNVRAGALDAGRALPPNEWVPEATLTELFDDGVRAGNGKSLALLAMRVRRADRDLEQVQGNATRLATIERELADTRSRLASSEAGEAALRAKQSRFENEREAAVANAAAIESSTSWRITAPLRAIARFLRF